MKRVMAVWLGVLVLAGCGDGEEDAGAGFPVSLARVEGIDLVERIDRGGSLRAKARAPGREGGA